MELLNYQLGISNDIICIIYRGVLLRVFLETYLAVGQKAIRRGNAKER